jgi:hypothetical protein
MVSEDNLSLLEDQRLTYLSAMDKDELACHPLFQEFVPEPASKDDYEQILALYEFQPADENQLFYTREGRIGKRRYIFSFDVSRFYLDIDSRESRISRSLAWIAEQNSRLRNTKRSRRLETTERDVQKMICRLKLKSLLTVTITPLKVEVVKKDNSTRFADSFQLTAEIDKLNEIKSRRKDGITCFITNDDTILQKDIIQSYRNKNKIEQAFHEMKSQLSMRPVFLTRPERVKAHISICVLAYLLISIMETMLKQSGCSLSPDQVLKQMESCLLNQVAFKDSLNHSVTPTKMTQQQEEFVRLLNLEKYLSPKAVAQLTKKVEKAL